MSWYYIFYNLRLTRLLKALLAEKRNWIEGTFLSFFRALTISYELVLFLFHFMTFEGTPCPKKDTLIWKIYISKAYSLPEKGTKLTSKAHSLPEKGTQPIFSPAAPAEAMPKFLFFYFFFSYTIFTQEPCQQIVVDVIL